jgi:NAD/NADP transhydrogenase beta subunit
MLPYLPAVAALAPNAIAMLMLAGTGADLGYGTSVSGSAGTNAATYSLWSADLVWVVAGIAALLLPGIVAGIVTRGRNASATPGMVAAAGAFAGLIALIVAIVAAPSLSAAASASTGASSGSTKFVFDLGQAVLIGAIITIGSAIAGYRFGGGLAAPVGNQVDRLAGIQ